jgi:hypothetical protein
MNQAPQAGQEHPPDSANASITSANQHAPLRIPNPVRVDGGVPQYVLIPILVSLHPGVETEGSLRNRIQKCEQAKRIGTATAEQLEFLHCVLRPAGVRRVLIHYPRYLHWLTGGRQGACA